MVGSAHPTSLTKEKWCKQVESFPIVGLRTVKQATAHTFELIRDGAFAKPQPNNIERKR